jgi:hypothetical protein
LKKHTAEDEDEYQHIFENRKQNYIKFAFNMITWSTSYRFVRDDKELWHQLGGKIPGEQPRETAET